MPRATALIGLLVLTACASGVRAPPLAEQARAADVPSRPTDVSMPTDAPRATAAATRSAATPVLIATGAPRDTNYRIGRDLETFVAPDAGVALDVLATRGAADNLHRLADDPRVDLAIVQYDVIRAMADEAKRGDPAATRLFAPLRIVTPLYAEEIHVVVRSDAPMRSWDDIRGKRINVGPRGSGSALTAAALYRRMFHTAIPSADVRYLSDDAALTALTLDRSVDVVVIVAAQPARVFADMKAAARDYVKLLPVDRDSPATQAASRVYLPATIHAASYASWLGRDVATLSVISFLVTTDRRDNALMPQLAAFARSLCRNLPTLQAEGHPKWREVQIGQSLGTGWKNDAASEAAFAQCAAH